MPANVLTPDEALSRADELAHAEQRRILGIAGAPGSGKSTLATLIVEALGPRAAYVPIDGFHLANAELERLGLRSVKGALETFDGNGVLALLRRVRAEADSTVYTPSFDRTIEEPVAGSIPIPPQAHLIVVEGNYVLHDRHPWSAVAGECDETWYLDVDEDTRIRRLIERHVRFGMAPDAAEGWARGTDQRNAELVAASRYRADRIVRADHPARSDRTAQADTAVAQPAGSIR
jgi:pantothenate kinase